MGFFLAVGLVACGWFADEDPARRPPEPTGPAVVEIRAPAAPWGPVTVTWDGDAPAVAGRLDGASLDPVPDGARAWYWPDQDLEPGPHTFALPGPDGDVTLAFEVEPFGRDPDFDPADVVGHTWAVSDFGVGPHADLVQVALQGADARLQITSVAPDGAAVFRLLGFGGTCVAFGGVGQLSPEGELTWHEDVATYDTTAGEARFWDLRLRVGFLGDRAVADLAGTADTRPWSTAGLGGAADACEVLATLEAECAPCPGGGPDCASVDAIGLGLDGEAGDVALLPACVFEVAPLDLDLDIDLSLPPVPCGDLGCGTTGLPSASLAALAAAAWLARRRSR